VRHPPGVKPTVREPTRVMGNRRQGKEIWMTRVTYEIRVEGEVPGEVLENFEGVTSQGETLDTTLRADLADAAALHGLLLALRGAGLVLLDVRREPGDLEDEPSATQPGGEAP
jgi:hypothetical protein